MKYQGKKFTYFHVQKLCMLIGCKIPKQKDCEYYRWQGEEVLKWDYIEGDSYIKISAYVTSASEPLLTRVFVDEYVDDEEEYGVKIAQCNYKFYDVRCDYCAINEKRNNPIWKNLQEKRVVNG